MTGRPYIPGTTDAGESCGRLALATAQAIIIGGCLVCAAVAITFAAFFIFGRI